MRNIANPAGCPVLPGNADGNSEVYLFDTTTGCYTQITNTTLGVSFPMALNAAGTRVAFLSDRNLANPGGCPVLPGNADNNTESPSPGLTITAMSGAGWTCTTLPTCTRSDVLAAGASYPAITVTVTVAANATSPQVNGVSVSTPQGESKQRHQQRGNGSHHHRRSSGTDPDPLGVGPAPDDRLVGSRDIPRPETSHGRSSLTPVLSR